MRLRRLVLTCGLLFVAQGAFCAEPSEEAEMRDLLALLEQQTSLATGSQLNADFVPGMATILRGEELRARGLRSVAESLALVPGISIGRESTGERLVLSRGVGHGYASGNIKFLLDGISVNSTVSAQNNPLLNMPVEQVERIEVIRGPGSSVHGEYAYAGVVNIVTRRQGRSVYAQAGSDSTWGGGGLFSWADPERGIALSVNLAHYDGDGPDSSVEQDGLYQTGDEAFSYAPGKASQAQEYSGLLADLSWGPWFASVKLLEDGFGDHFGINHYLPPNSHRKVTTNDFLIGEVGRNFTLAENLTGSLRLEALNHQRERDRLYVAPAGYYAEGGSDIRMDLDYQERRYLGALDLHWRPHRDHQVLLALEASNTDIEQGTWDWYGGFEEFSGTEWIDEGTHRAIRSLALQDEYRLNDQLTLTGTLRYDDYSDLGDVVSPRLAAVWRMNRENILKLQYARAFRPPTFYELNSPGEGEPLDFSEIETFELGYILKRPDWEAKATLFHSLLIDPIVFDDPTAAGYINADDFRLRGIELEYQRRFGQDWRLDANLSYVDAEERESGTPLPGETAWLANLGLIWQPDARWTLALQGQYVGDRERYEQDPRDALEGYATLDGTLTWRPGPKGVTLRGGVRNLTDADVRYPDQITTDADNQIYLGYPDDYPQAGRQWWLTLAYEF